MARSHLVGRPRPGDYQSFVQREASWIWRILRHGGKGSRAMDIIDPTGLMRLTWTYLTLPTGLYLGQTFADRQSSKAWRLVRAAASGLVTVTDPDLWGFETAGLTVTNDLSTCKGRFAGISVGVTPAVNEYFWVQIAGIVEDVTIDGANLTAGEAVIHGADNDMKVRTAATYTEPIIGYAPEDGSGTGTIFLTPDIQRGII